MKFCLSSQKGSATLLMQKSTKSMGPKQQINKQNNKQQTPHHTETMLTDFSFQSMLMHFEKCPITNHNISQHSRQETKVNKHINT